MNDSLSGWLSAPQSPASGLAEWIASLGVAAPAGAPAPAGLVGASRLDEGGLLCVVAGAVGWRSAELERVAREQGQAAALARAYRSDRNGFTRRLSGQYACALIEPTESRVTLIVDRMGSIPIVYALTPGGGVVFSSSAEVLRRHPQVDGRLSAQALYDYVFFHMVPSPETVYRGISRLEPASVLTIERGRVSSRRHWSPRFATSASQSETQLAESLRQRLFDAVKACEPDATTGAFLSGGLDSSSVAGALARVGGQPARTYSMGFGVEQYDEMSYVRTVAAHFKLDSKEYYVQPDDVAAAVPEIAAHYDQPFGNSSAVPTLLCARLAARSGTKKLLAGDGGDEIFGGNQRYADQKVFAVYGDLPGIVRGAMVNPLAALGRALPVFPLRKIDSYVTQARVPMPDRVERYNFLNRVDQTTVFEPEFLAAIDRENPQRLLRACYGEAQSDDIVDRMLYLDWKFTLADNDLRKVSAMCSLAGIDVRYPMLDDALVDLSVELPPDWKVRGQTLRWFYKRALTGFLPDDVITKKKHGFGLPFGDWLKTHPPLQELSGSALQAMKSRGIFKPAFLDEILATHRTGHASYYGTFIWVLLMLELWLQSHGHAPSARAT
jgi:asparagine synthase (glutamine-hydrolysing)